MKVSHLYYLIIAFANMLLMNGCKEDDLIQHEINKDISSARIYSGRNRLLLTWRNHYPKTFTAKIYWNNHTDSLIYPIGTGMDSVKIFINDLQEGTYNIDLFAFDNENRDFGETNLSGYVYGDKYAASVTDKKLDNITYLSNYFLKIDWVRWIPLNGNTAIGSEVIYKNTDGKEQKTFFEITALVSEIPDITHDLRGTIKYRTVYSPNQSVIDTLFSEYITTPFTNRLAVFDSLPGWKFRCKVMAEAQTIQDFGKKMAFMEKMDDALKKASAKFQVAGLNNEGNNEIHFYMTEMIPFTGLSKTYMYNTSGQTDNAMDIRLIVNNNDGPEDVAGGWLSAPYLSLGHNYDGLFGSKAIDALVHEFGHARGMFDLYLGTVPKAANNPVNGQTYNSKIDIMNYPYGEKVWSEFTSFIINTSAGKKVATGYWLYFPESFKVTVKQKDGTTAQNAQLNFYPVGLPDTYKVRATTAYKGTTGVSGTYTFPNNPFAYGQNVRNNIYNYLVEVVYNGQKSYIWMPMEDALLAGSNNQPYVLNMTLNE